ncbi:hypothetical protein HUG10_11730 [Halorarum halophilum]|uniref:Uncharacterized protein n=1 Tax=Halorarum halophilum TaxID=2743090 RepID=A0A7D5KXG0_9EURY|nr:hypothetical protein [Halobaculum halophilum]QLG28178.1 hypothetical protein HUG10_11730 [Halobaculum halophilum]
MTYRIPSQSPTGSRNSLTGKRSRNGLRRIGRNTKRRRRERAMSEEPPCPRCGLAHITESVDGLADHLKACPECEIRFDLRYFADWSPERKGD